NGGTLFNAEFGIRHRAAPYRKGQVLHSVFAAALYKQPKPPMPASRPNKPADKYQNSTMRIS
ncbi:hypothetical protein ACSEPD_23950, partial [Pseudomonas aeruginosa]